MLNIESNSKTIPFQLISKYPVSASIRSKVADLIKDLSEKGIIEKC